uniref:Aminotransferase-like plant mobile domain-containing protein n=1 Tax=Fagus sylvatica TaxID=28930 RepID=A0A2N9HP86_FAGSY
MASSSKRTRRGSGGTFSSEGGSSVARGAAARAAEDSGDSSYSGSRSPEPLGDILGRPTVDPWYRSDWIDLELADRGFCDRLEQAGVLRSILVSRCSNMYRDTEALRQLVRRWCPSTHTFFFANGELSVTLKDVENHWLLPILGDQGPADLVLSPEELEIESALADYIGRKNIALGTQATRFKPWMKHFNRETDPLIRRAAFVAYWLSKCVFGEHPAYSIKPLYFPLAVKIAAGVCFPLAPLLLGQLYTQLDLLHAEELAGASCHIVTTAFNSSIVHTFLWEHALEYIKKGRKPYEARNKFASMPEGVVTNIGDFQGDVPAVYRWVGSKFYDHGLVPSLDSESKICWRPYGVSHRGFVYESVMSGFSNVEAQDYTLIAGDMASLTYLSATNAGWLPVLSSSRLQFTVYSAHRVRKQFGFDQEIPAVMGIAAGEIPTINPFLKASAFAYWSGVAPRVIIPSGDRIGVYTTGMSNYWRGLMAAMVEFRNSGRGDISHLLESYTCPLPHPRLFVATNTMTTYTNRQSLGYAVWHHENSQWVIHGSPHPPLWLRDHPHVAAPGKVPSSRGRRIASAGSPAVKRKQPDRSKKSEVSNKNSPVQAYKKKKISAAKGSKEVLVLKTAVASPPPAGEDVPQGVSAHASKKPMKKTRAGKRTFVPPAFPSAPSSIAARIAASKLSRGVVYSEKRQRADSSSRVPIEILDDLDSSSSSSDPSGAAAEEVEGEDAEAGAAEAVSGADDFAANISSVDTINPMSAEEAVEEHAAVGVVTDAERVVETTPIAVTSSGGTIQGGPSGSGSRVDPSLLDSSPSTRQYSSPESGGIALTPTTIAAETSAAATIQESEVVPTAIEGIPVGEEGPAHVPDIPEGNNFVESISIDENLVIDTDFCAGVTQIERAEVVASEEPVQADVTPGSGVPVIEEELAQGPVDDVDMADTMIAMMKSWLRQKIIWLVLRQQIWSGNEAVAKEERRHQTAAVESAIRAVVQEAIEGGFKFGFILDNLRRLAHDIFSRRILAELRAAEACVVALRDALNMVAPNPWDLAFAKRVSAESHAESALYGLLA